MSRETEEPKKSIRWTDLTGNDWGVVYGNYTFRLTLTINPGKPDGFDLWGRKDSGMGFYGTTRSLFDYLKRIKVEKPEEAKEIAEKFIMTLF